MNFIQRLKQRKEDVANGINSATDYIIKNVTEVASTVVETVKENVIQPIVELDEAVVNQRFETCLKCDRFNHETQRCNECGCFMKIKTKFTQASCPLNKW